MIVYTAIFGKYDDPKDLIDVNGINFLSFNENNTSISEIKDIHPRMQAKFFKMHPVFDFENISIWIDGSAVVKDRDFKTFALKSLGDADISCFVNPENRKTILAEAEYCYSFQKYQNQPIKEQAQFYLSQGFKDNLGLYACGMMIYRNNPRTKQFLDMWWEENKKWSYQDQISFSYLLSKNIIKFNPIRLNQYQNKYITFLTDQHKSLK